MTENQNSNIFSFFLARLFRSSLYAALFYSHFLKCLSSISRSLSSLVLSITLSQACQRTWTLAKGLGLSLLKYERLSRKELGVVGYWHKCHSGYVGDELLNWLSLIIYMYIDILTNIYCCVAPIWYPIGLLLCLYGLWILIVIHSGHIYMYTRTGNICICFLSHLALGGGSWPWFPPPVLFLLCMSTWTNFDLSISKRCEQGTF